MRFISNHILRIGLGITFLWIGILIFQNPEAWGSFMRPWATNLVPIDIVQAMIGTAILDIVIGALLICGFFTRLAAFVGSLHLVIILVVSGINDVTVRDIGLLGASLALALNKNNS